MLRQISKNKPDAVINLSTKFVLPLLFFAAGVSAIAAEPPSEFEKYPALDMNAMDVVNMPEVTADTNGSVAPEKFSATAKNSDGDDEYNFSWLDPEKKVYVLQNRKYRKAGHAGIFLGGAMNLSGPFKTHYMGVPRLGYWFTENMGVELFYALGSNQDTSTLASLRKVSASALPFVREVRSYFGAVFSWVPWYAKLNFFNKILYLDWALNAGVGRVNTAFDQNNRATSAPNYLNESFTGLFLGTSQNYFVSRNWSVRLDLISYMYNAKGADNESTNTYKNFDFGVGVGYLF